MKNVKDEDGNAIRKKDHNQSANPERSPILLAAAWAWSLANFAGSIDKAGWTVSGLRGGSVRFELVVDREKQSSALRQLP